VAPVPEEDRYNREPKLASDKMTGSAATMSSETGGAQSVDAADGEKTAAGQEVIDIQVEFGGGLETLFSNASKLAMRLTEPHTMRHLVEALSCRVTPPKSLPLFCSPGPHWDIKPGILPLVNDEDWELLEPSGMDASLKHGDNVLFISTLHGG